MKGALLVASALAVTANAAAIEARQRGGDRPSGRPGNGSGPGKGGKKRQNDPSDRFSLFPSTPFLSIGIPSTENPSPPRPTQNDPSPPLSECGLDSFGSHTAEASQFCSSFIRTGTATATQTVSTVYTVTTRSTVTVTLAPSNPPPPPPPPPPPTTPPSPPPPSSTPRPPPPPSSTPRPPTSTAGQPSSTAGQPSSAPAPSSSAGCGLVGYTKGTAAYYFDSSGTKNTFANCSAACKADTRCKSFGYGEANCMLFDVKAADNVQYNPMSPYTFYDATCPTELPVKAGATKRQINISIPFPFPGGGPGEPTTTGDAALSSACTCLITKAPASTTVSTTKIVTGNRITVTQTITTTVGAAARRLKRS